MLYAKRCVWWSLPVASADGRVGREPRRGRCSRYVGDEWADSSNYQGVADCDGLIDAVDTRNSGIRSRCRETILLSPCACPWEPNDGLPWALPHLVSEQRHAYTSLASWAALIARACLDRDGIIDSACHWRLCATSSHGTGSGVHCEINNCIMMHF